MAAPPPIPSPSNIVRIYVTDLENNRIVDSGAETGMGIDVQGETAGVVLSRNEIREDRGPAKRVGIRLGARIGDVQLVDNRIEGFATTILDLRKTD